LNYVIKITVIKLLPISAEKKRIEGTFI